MIRLAQENDIEKILDIWFDCCTKNITFIPESYWEKMRPVVKKYYFPNAENYVFEDKHKIKGFISIIDEKYVGALFVSPEFQHHKIGTKLLNYVKKFLPELSLKVFVKNEKAIKFYQDNDFKIVSEQTDDSTNEQELLMSWLLPCKTGTGKRHPGDS